MIVVEEAGLRQVLLVETLWLQLAVFEERFSPLETWNHSPKDFRRHVHDTLIGTSKAKAFLAFDVPSSLEPKTSETAIGVAVVKEANTPRYLVHAKRAELVALFVQPTHRGKGAADGLMVAVKAWCRKKSIPLLTLHVHNTNERAKAFYTKHGLTPEHVVMVGSTEGGPNGPTEP
jgi:GNAT superfamily N-acetyltransferase